MQERFNRLRLARERRGLSSPKEAADRFGWNYNTYASNENGNAPFSYKMAKKYAAGLQVRAEWLMDGIGPMVEQRAIKDRAVITMPFVSWVSAGSVNDVGSHSQEDASEFVLVGGLPPSQYFATRVVGDSMDRLSPEGSIIIVDYSDVEAKPGKAYLFSVHGETTYKIYQDMPITRLEPFSTNPFNKAIYPDKQGLSVVGRVVRSWIDLD